uniref:Cytochrome P450 n=1 Tax=Stomoxys calcitrans TaxID=35570 RepID=A0A1I8P6L7_STOCA
MENLITVCFVFTTCLALCVRFWFQNKFRYWSQHDVPHAKASIFSGNFWDFFSMKTNFFYHLKTIYDDPRFENEAAVGVYGVYTPGLLIRDPELIKAVLVKDFEKFGNRTFQCNARSDPIGNMALFFSPFSYWRRMRPKLSPAFSSGKLKHMYPLLQAVGKSLEDNLQAKGDEFVQEFKQICGQFTTDVIATTILGYQSHALQNSQDPLYLEAIRLVKFNIRRAICILVLMFMPRLSGPLGVKLFHEPSYSFIRNSVRQVVEHREKTGQKRNDIVDIYVVLKKDAAAAGEDEHLTMDSLAAQSAMLMGAGYDTSSTIISSALFELAQYPDIRLRLRREVLENFLDGDGQISYERINSMEYLGMVVEETMRKYPVLPLLDRKYMATDKNSVYSLKPFYNYVVPDGMHIFISAYGLHYDPKYWPNPTKFDPERFSAKNRKTINPMTYLPFGSGPRNCVGSRLGLLQVKIALAHILKNHDVQLSPETNLNPKLNPKAFILQIEGGINLTVVRDNMFDNAAATLQKSDPMVELK